jgi:hypothetical protein
MLSYKLGVAVTALACATLGMSTAAVALDIGGQNGISVGSNGSGGLGVSVGGRTGVNGSVGSRPSGALGVDASIGGSSGLNSNTSVGGSKGGLGVGTRAGIGGSNNVRATVNATLGGSSLATTRTDATINGSRGVAADVDATVGGTRLGSARATVGSTGTTLADILLGSPPTAGRDANGGNDTGESGIASSSGSRIGNPATERQVRAIRDMSSLERAKAKVRCKDVLRSGGYDAGLTSLCKIVVSMR